MLHSGILFTYPVIVISFQIKNIYFLYFKSKVKGCFCIYNFRRYKQKGEEPEALCARTRSHGKVPPVCSNKPLMCILQKNPTHMHSVISSFKIFFILLSEYQQL